MGIELKTILESDIYPEDEKEALRHLISDYRTAPVTPTRFGEYLNEIDYHIKRYKSVCDYRALDGTTEGVEPDGTMAMHDGGSGRFH